jgi:hypothetical protein
VISVEKLLEVQKPETESTKSIATYSVVMWILAVSELGLIALVGVRAWKTSVARLREVMKLGTGQEETLSTVSRRRDNLEDPLRSIRSIVSPVKSFRDDPADPLQPTLTLLIFARLHNAATNLLQQPLVPIAPVEPFRDNLGDLNSSL